MKVDAVSLVIGLVCVAVALVALLEYSGRLSVSHLGVIAPVTLILIGVIGLLASRRNQNP